MVLTMIKEFPMKGWNVLSVNRVLKGLLETVSTDRHPGTVRLRTSRTTENIGAVNDLILSQESAPHTHRTTRQLAREREIPQLSVACIIHKDV